MNREDGYYWCKISGTWDIFICWESNRWCDGMENSYKESDFEEIDEKRIIREE